MAILDLIGSSTKFRALLDNVAMVAPVDSAVLIQGETGTGKEVIARAIHEASPRLKKRFVPLNCAEIAVARFLIKCEDEGIELVQCPLYVREWMRRERAEAAQPGSSNAS